MSWKHLIRQHVSLSTTERLISLERWFRHELFWHINPKKWASQSHLRKFKNKHLGERCFIIGNGPSLRHTNLSLLKNEITFGLNRIYLLFDELGFDTTYFVTVNHLVIEQFANEIVRAIPGPKFVDWNARNLFPSAKNMMYLRSFPLEPRFFNNIEHGVWQGTTVTYVAMQIAFYMGFREVILVGVDHSFTSKGPAHQVVTTENTDPNHFNDQYFGKGIRWQLPDLDGSELAYRLAKYQFERHGRNILDATVNGKLQVFDKARLEDIIEGNHEN
jgi:hypothetical protein